MEPTSVSMTAVGGRPTSGEWAHRSGTPVLDARERRCSMPPRTRGCRLRQRLRPGRPQRKVSLAGGERSERAGRREVVRVSPDGRPFVTEPVHRPPQPLAARQRTVGYRRRYVGTTEVVGGDDPQRHDIAHQFTLPGLRVTPRVYESVQGLTTPNHAL